MTPGFRHEFRNLSPADVLTVLGWILDPVEGDPEPSLSDALLIALHDLHKAYRLSYDELATAAGGN